MSYKMVLIIAVSLLMAASGFGQADNETLRFAIIGDRTGSHDLGVWGQVLREAESLRPEFMITVGDMIEGYTEDSTTLVNEWSELHDLVGGLSMPIHFTPGNHDITSPGMLESYLANAGEPYYSFDRRGVHLVVIDNSAGAGGPSLPLSDEQFEWLSNDLAQHEDARATLVFCHKPFFFASLGLGKTHRLHDLFLAHGVDVVYSGHFHRYFAGEYDGIKYISLGSSGGGITERPDELGYHFAWVTVDNEGVHTSPIAMGATREWDYFTAHDLMTSNRIERGAITFKSPAMIGDDFSLPPTAINVEVTNQSRELEARDSLSWSVPDGWEVQPLTMPFVIPPGETIELQFSASCTALVYPAPSVVAHFPLSGENQARCEKQLWLGRQAVCHPVSGTVNLDGLLDESFWMEPVEKMFSPDGGQTAIEPVEFHFAHDDLNVYIGVDCRETEPDSIRASVVERDGPVYGEDCVGFFIAPDPYGDTVYQLYVNPLGTVFDQKIGWGDSEWYETDREWNGVYEIATATTDEGWSIEIRIPLTTFGQAEFSDSGWGVNFRRKQKRLNASGDWLVPIDYAPETYGRLIFSDR